MSVLEDLADFCASVSVDRVPASACDQLRLHLFDTLGAALAGGRTREGDAATRLVRAADAPGKVPAIGLPVQTTPSLAALATCMTTRCTEVDDIHLPSCTTPSAIVVPTALALAWSDVQIDDAAFLAGLLAGYEIVTRLGQAVDGPTILYRGIWPTYLAGSFGAAATAARALGLPAAETAHALAAASTLATGTSGRITGGVSSRWLTLGCAVQSGILAALAASNGWRGDLTLLDGGWSRVTGIGLDARRLTARLGHSFAIEQVSIKPYCAAKQTIASIEGFISLLDDEQIDPATIDRVIISVPGRYAPMIDQPALPMERMDSIVSVQYQLALAAYHREELTDVTRSVIHTEPPVRDLMAKIQVHADDRLLAYYPEAWPARVEVLQGSRHFEREVQHTKGDPVNPFTWDEAVSKVQRVVAGILDQPAVERLATVCRHLGERTRVTDLLPLLTRIVSSSP